jgi:hypothetical protein
VVKGEKSRSTGDAALKVALSIEHDAE